MDIQKMATYGTAAAVVGTGSLVGGNVALDRATGGPEKRVKAEATELRLIVREEVRAAITEAWPTTTGHIKGMKPNGNYREILNGSDTTNTTTK
tara:strand:+ start:1760 stop:2041 length:282 start_codon:yes stop_codon:yes gene_type:complete